MPNEKEKYFKNYKLENIPDDSRKGYRKWSSTDIWNQKEN
mgnify:CR=1 FL=1